MTANELTTDIEKLIIKINSVNIIKVANKANDEDRLELIKSLENLNHFSGDRLKALLI